MKFPASWDHLRTRAAQIGTSGSNDASDEEIDWDALFDQAWLHAARRFDSSARLRPELAVHVAGDKVGPGRLRLRLADDLFGPLQSEVDAALPNSAVTELELTGVSAGSAVLHFQPSDHAEAHGSGHLPLAVSQIDHAISRVLDVHDAVENESSPDEIRSLANAMGVLQHFSRLTNVLDEHGLTLAMAWRSGDGRRRRSNLSRRGLSYGRELFEWTQYEEIQHVSGFVYVQSMRNLLTLKADPANDKSKTYEIVIPRTTLQAATLTLGQYVRVHAIHRYRRNQLGQTSEHKYEFVGFADDASEVQ